MHAVFQVCLKCFSQHGYQIDLLWEVSFRVQACLFLAFVGSAAVQKSTFKWWIPSKSKLPFIARTFIDQYGLTSMKLGRPCTERVTPAFNDWLVLEPGAWLYHSLGLGWSNQESSDGRNLRLALHLRVILVRYLLLNATLRIYTARQQKHVVLLMGLGLSISFDERWTEHRKVYSERFCLRVPCRVICATN